MGSVTELGRSPEVENGNSFQYSCLKIPMNRGAYWATVQRIAESQAQLTTDTHTHTHTHMHTMILKQYWAQNMCLINFSSLKS